MVAVEPDREEILPACHRGIVVRGRSPGGAPRQGQMPIPAYGARCQFQPSVAAARRGPVARGRGAGQCRPRYRSSGHRGLNDRDEARARVARLATHPETTALRCPALPGLRLPLTAKDDRRRHDPLHDAAHLVAIHREGARRIGRLQHERVPGDVALEVGAPRA